MSRGVSTRLLLLVLVVLCVLLVCRQLLLLTAHVLLTLRVEAAACVVVWPGQPLR